VNRRTFLSTLGLVTLAEPLAVEAQQPKRVWRVGSLHPTTPAVAAPLVAAFEKGLAARGHVKGSTTTIEYVFVPPSLDPLRQAARVLSKRVDLLVVWGTVTAIAAKAAKVAGPVVFVAVGFPVALGLVHSLRRPGGNFTGLSSEAAGDTYGKRLQILKEIVPSLTRVAALGALDDPNIIPSLETLHRVAPSLGVDIVEMKVRSVTDLEPAFAEMRKEKAHGVVVIAGAFMFQNRDRVAKLALAHSLPSVYGLREGVLAGGLVSLGPDLALMAEQAATYVDKILRGARPGNLPVEQPARYEMLLNLKTAKALGLTIPQSLLLRADQIIE
jgi:putative ABC transport system substrate-binding protein